MTSFEESSGGGSTGEQNSQGTVVVPIPEDVDWTWCNMLAEAYGRGDFRICLKTASYMRLQLPMRDKHKRYDSYGCLSDDGELTEIEGLLVGTKMIPEFTDGGDYIPHAVLVDVEQYQSPFWIADNPEQEFLVPLDMTDDELILYPDRLY